jgi:hypothetical protein
MYGDLVEHAMKKQKIHRNKDKCMLLADGSRILEDLT